MNYILMDCKNFKTNSLHIFRLLCGADEISDIAPKDYAAWLDKVVLGVIQGTRSYALAISDGRISGFLQWSGTKDIAIEDMAIDSDMMTIELLRVLADNISNSEYRISNIPKLNNLSDTMTVEQLKLVLDIEPKLPT